MASEHLNTLLGYVRRVAGATGLSDATDSHLLASFVARQDQAAFEALVRRHAALVYGVCRRVLRHTEDAEDAFQATFLVLAHRSPLIRHGQALSSWLHGVAFRLALKARIGAGRRRQQERQVAIMPQSDLNVEDAWTEIEPLLDAELQQLPEKYRLPLIRCYLEGKSTREAARELGWPIGSMSRRLERGRELLRSRLQRRGVALSTALLSTALAERVSATVPERLAHVAFQAAALAAGKPVQGFSTQAVSWAEAAVHSSGMSKMKLTITIVAALCLTSVGGAALYQVVAVQKTELVASAPAEAPAAPVAAAARLVEEPKQPGTEVNALLGKGPLHGVRQQLRPIFAFTFDGARLKMDRSRWTGIATLFRQLSDATGSENTSGSSLPGDNDHTTYVTTFPSGFVHGNISGRLYLVTGAKKEILAMRLSLEETEPASRTLLFRDDGQGALSLQLTIPTGDSVFLSQAGNGHFKVTAIAGDRVFRAEGETFGACVRKHRQALEAHVLPVLAHYGIQLFLSSRTLQVRQAALALLARSPQTLAEGRRLLDELDAKDFATRQRASQKLNERFQLYEDLIRQALQDKPSLELQQRLEGILKEHPDTGRVLKTITTLGLLQDVGYLIEVMDYAQADDTARLTAELEKLTAQKLGADPAAWKEWARRNLE